MTLHHLTLPEKVTRRFIMQKARSHSTKLLLPLVGRRVQDLLHSSVRGSFHLPSRYWFTIGLSGVFSLTGWAPQIHTGFHVSRATQDTSKSNEDFRIHSCHVLWPAFPDRSPNLVFLYRGPTTPVLPKQIWFGLVPVRSPLLRESLLFSSPMGT